MLRDSGGEQFIQLRKGRGDQSFCLRNRAAGIRQDRVLSGASGATAGVGAHAAIEEERGVSSNEEILQ